MTKAEAVAKLKLAGKKHIDWALRKGDITGIDLSHRHWCFERGCELGRIADELEKDDLTHTLDCWRGKKNEQA